MILEVFSDLNDSDFKAKSLEATQSPVLEGEGAELCWLRARAGAGARGAPGASEPLGQSARLQREPGGGRTAGAVLLCFA